MADRSPVSLQILQRQGGAGQDSRIQLTEWTFRVAASEKKSHKYLTKT